jgi:RpiR family transcriptional regulator, carbohydrate utilization regulator
MNQDRPAERGSTKRINKNGSPGSNGTDVPEIDVTLVRCPASVKQIFRADFPGDIFSTGRSYRFAPRLLIGDRDVIDVESHNEWSLMPSWKENGHSAYQPQLSHPLDRLSVRHQNIIRPVFESPREFVLLNVRDMARQLATAPTTVVRVVQALGFRSHKEFQHYLHSLSVTSATILDSMRAGSHAAQPPRFLSDTRKQIQLNLGFVQHNLDLQQVLKVATRIHEAKSILILGGDMASSLVNYMEYHLTIAGLPVLAAVAPGRATHLARSTGKADIVIGISFRRGLRMTIEGIERAKKNGAYCVGITDSMLSPLGRFSDELLIVPIDSLSFAASYVAPLALIDLITAGVGSLRRKQVVNRLKEADLEQKHGYRWYQTES